MCTVLKFNIPTILSSIFSGFSENLPVRLIQEYGVGPAVAQRLSKAYGGRAKDVLEIARAQIELCLTPNDESLRGKSKTSVIPNKSSDHLKPRHYYGEKDILLVPGYPYIEAEVIYGCRHEFVRHPGMY